MPWTIGEVARAAAVTVRTLHHYDAIGLLTPSARTAAGYRLYDVGDLERLQRILAYRSFGLSLDKIAALLDDPDVDPLDHLRTQHELLTERRDELNRMIEALEKTMEARKLGIQLEPEEMFEVFGDFDPTEHEAEVQERWGETDAYKESARRTAHYTKADWQRFKDEAEEINMAIAALIDEGIAPDDPRAMDAVDRARLQIDQWFYPCSREMHANLGEMYVADPRFTATYEKIRPGMARWMRDATAANATRGSR